ncbi:hypothetical protein MRX96_039932 [Rhipicephalus microplus]
MLCATIADTAVFHPVDALLETVAVSSLRAQRVSFGFLPLTCLLENASCIKAHLRGLPFCLHFVTGLPSTQLLITALVANGGRRMVDGLDLALPPRDMPPNSGSTICP